MKLVAVGKYLARDPRICHGQLTFRGTRVPVETILNWLAKGKSMESILTDWPYLSRQAILEAMHLATYALAERFPPKIQKNNESNHSGRATGRKRTGRSPAKMV